MGEGKIKGRWKGRRGREGGGKRREKEGGGGRKKVEGKGRGIPLRMKILATVLR